MSPGTFCKCGAGVCGNHCCKTMQNPKTCDGIWYGNKGSRKLIRSVSSVD